MGDHRAAPADPRRQPRAHRRARGGHDRAGSARARHGLWWHPALPRGAGASGRGPSPGRSRRRRSRARLGARGALRAARGPALRHAGGAAGGRDGRRRRARGRSLAARRDHVHPGPGAGLEPPGSGRRARPGADRGPSGPLPLPARAAARGRVRVAAALVAPQGARPALRRPHPRRAERLACPRVALRACGAPPGGGGRLPAHGRVGAAAWGAGRGSVAPHAGDRPRHAAGRRRDARSSRDRAAPAPGVPRHVRRGRGQRRCVRRLRPLPRAGGGRSHGRRHVQHADLGVGLRPVTGRARPRPPPVRGAARRPRRRA